MQENPYEPQSQEPSRELSGHSEKPEVVSKDRAAYNLVTDTVTGVNARRSDNRFQLIFVLIATAVGAGAMAILAVLYPHWSLPWYGGALIGSFLGMVFGIFASGVVLMIYRTWRHLQVKHD
jgi:hypothetical protein